MFLKPDYNLKNIYEINLEELKSRGIKNILFDLDSTLMQSKTANYTQKTLEWLSKVRRDFFIAVLSNNHNDKYIAKVKQVTDFPMIFYAKKPDTRKASEFLKEHNLKTSETAIVGDRPLSDIWCGKRLGCLTILVDSISADVEKPIVRLARRLERLAIKK